MPEISRFYGIIIRMYYREHGAPHFHAEAAGEFASFSIDEVRLMEGSVSRRAEHLVVEWAQQHQAKLRDDWERARSARPLMKIAPLD